MDTKIKSTAGLNFASDGNFHWAGATYRSLGGAGTYNPRVPMLVGTGNKSRAEDDIAWDDQPKWSALRTRLANKGSAHRPGHHPHERRDAAAPV